LAEQIAAAAHAGAQLVELRVDLIEDLAQVEEVLRAARRLPLLVTLRCAAEGGAWRGTERERITLLTALADLEPDFLDLEFKSLRDAPALAALGAVRRRNRPRLIVSWHDTIGCPPDPREIARLQRAAAPAAITKTVCAARDARDALRMLRVLRDGAPAGGRIALAMGAAGLASRVLARKFGAFLTFASPMPDTQTAPGQPTIDELRRVYRWDEITPISSVFGVVGWPVEHSLSPLVHNAAMRDAGIDGVYLPLPVLPEKASFDAFMKLAESESALDLRGLSVTIPHKMHALTWLDERRFPVSDDAQRCGAVNTLIRTKQGWRGENTDVSGFLTGLSTLVDAPAEAFRESSAAVLGAGGVAAAVVAGLRKIGCDVTVYNRTRERGAALAGRFGCGCAPWADRQNAGHDIVVNCTSVGMWPAVDASPLDPFSFKAECIVCDTVYRPARTKLLRDAEACGCRTLGGVEMFIAQAGEQFSLWHARPAPLAVMRAAIPPDNSDAPAR